MSTVYDHLFRMRMALYDELEQVLENCIAAGVPMSDFEWFEPQMEWNGTTATMHQKLGFTDEAWATS